MTKAQSASRLTRFIVWTAVVLVTACALFYGFKRLRQASEVRLAERDAVQVISRNLGVPPDRITCESVMIDDYMDYYGMYFHVRTEGMTVSPAGLVDYKTDSQERESLRLHRTGVRQLRRLKWGPVEAYRQCPEYVGVWDRDYLVYLAMCGDGVDGYYENRYSKEPGPGPFN